MNKRVAVGMSGGVDSSVSAALLVEQGYEVTGVYLECWKEPGCRTEEDRKDALAVALKLGIPFQVLDFKKEYKQKVVEYFYDEYRVGRTPNPDVMCNKEIKFGLFYEWALRQAQGKPAFDFVATGHYARVVRKTQTTLPRRQAGQRARMSEIPDSQNIRRSESLNLRSSDTQSIPSFLNGEFSEYSLLRGIDEKKDPRKTHLRELRGKQSYFLLRGLDDKKDQSYFLYRLRLEQLPHILFPIGEMTKGEVREEARKRNVVVADKPDSQGICFIGDVNVQEFLRERLPEKKGEVVDTSGNVIGEHDGVWFYTIGQRHGFTVNGELRMKNEEFRHEIPPMYVIAKDAKTNMLTVGFGAETYTSQFAIDDCNWLNEELRIENGEWTSGAQVRIRHGGKLINAKLRMKPFDSAQGKNEELSIELEEPQRGIASGQSAVFYKNDTVLGGGIIC